MIHSVIKVSKSRCSPIERRMMLYDMVKVFNIIDVVFRNNVCISKCKVYPVQTEVLFYQTFITPGIETRNLLSFYFVVLDSVIISCLIYV